MLLTSTTSPSQSSLIHLSTSHIFLQEITAGSDTVQMILSILRKPEFHPKIFAKQIKSLKKCGEIAQAIADKMVRNLWPDSRFPRNRSLQELLVHSHFHHFHGHFLQVCVNSINSSYIPLSIYPFPLVLYRIHAAYDKHNNIEL